MMQPKKRPLRKLSKQKPRPRRNPLPLNPSRKSLLPKNLPILPKNTLPKRKTPGKRKTTAKSSRWMTAPDMWILSW